MLQIYSASKMANPHGVLPQICRTMLISTLREDSELSNYIITTQFQIFITDCRECNIISHSTSSGSLARKVIVQYWYISITRWDICRNEMNKNWRFRTNETLRQFVYISNIKAACSTRKMTQMWKKVIWAELSFIKPLHNWFLCETGMLIVMIINQEMQRKQHFVI